MAIGDWSTIKTCRKLGQKILFERGFALLLNIITTPTFTNSSYLNIERDCSLKPLEVPRIDFIDAFCVFGILHLNKPVWKQATTLLDFLS